MLDTVEKQQVLEASEFFADVPAFLRESILSSACLRSFACRDLMFVVDGPRNETLLLMKGCAKIAQFTKDGKEIALRLAVPGELVSELGSRPESLHSTTALALFECEALAWPTETFDALLRFPILQRNVENILRRRIKEMEDRICRVTNQGAEHRVASELVRLSKLMGQKVNNHVEIMIPQETLGQMTAMNLFTVNRTLRVAYAPFPPSKKLSPGFGGGAKVAVTVQSSFWSIAGARALIQQALPQLGKHARRRWRRQGRRRTHGK